MLDLQNNKIAIFGIQGSGKTYLAKYLIRNFKTLVYEVNPDYRDTNAYVYQGSKTLQDLNKFCENVKELALKRKINAFLLDEADLFFRSNYDLQPNLNDLVINHRHYNLALFFISRRPQDIPTKIVESCHYIIIFKLEGANAINKFKEIDERILPLLEKLQYKDYRFIVKEIGKEPYICEKV